MEWCTYGIAGWEESYPILKWWFPPLESNILIFQLSNYVQADVNYTPMGWNQNRALWTRIFNFIPSGPPDIINTKII